MAFQLFAAAYSNVGDAVRREGSGGDGGLEGYVPDTDDRVRVALQAKYYPEKLGTTQWKHIDGSVRTILSRNSPDNAVHTIIVATPINFNETQQTKWNELKANWTSLAQDLQYPETPRFHHWSRSRLISCLLRPEARGQLLYWFRFPSFGLDRCWQISRWNIENLGDRYVPGLHTSTQPEETLHWFLGTEHARELFVSQLRERLPDWVQGGWRERDVWPPSLEALARQAKEVFAKATQQLGNGSSFPRSIKEFRNSVADFCRVWSKLYTACLMPSPGKLDKELVKELDGLGSPHELLEFGESPIDEAQCLLIDGAPGTGKSHTLAHICCELIEAGAPVIFYEAGVFTSGDSPWTQLLRLIDFPGTTREFLDTYSAAALSVGLPGVICIDGLNETTDRNTWLKHLASFASELKDFSQLRLIVSCRSDYLEIVVPERILNRDDQQWGKLTHGGLGRSSTEAIAKYLAAYSIINAGAISLDSEYTNPLMLKLFCEAFEGSTADAGSLTLDSVLRKLVDRKAALIQLRIGCPVTIVWQALLKLADAMVESSAHVLDEVAARNLLAKFHMSTEDAKSLYRAFVSERLLHEVRRSGEWGAQIFVRFPFEKVWDYFYLRSIWPAGTVLPETLKDQLKNPKWHRRFGGLIEIIGLRIAEEEQAELHDTLHVQPGSNRIFDRAFLSGLVRRDRNSWTERTTEIRSQIAEDDYGLAIRVAANPTHPRNAMWLHRNLMSQPIGQRDRVWTRWLNAHFGAPRPSDLLEHQIRLAELIDQTQVSRPELTLLAVLISWFATTTAVKERHRCATALARCLQGRCDIAVDVLERFLNVDDPYVLESVLYACASAATTASNGDPDLERLGLLVFESIFGRDEVNPNAIIRHYAHLVCECANRKTNFKQTVDFSKACPPYRSTLPGRLTDAELEALSAHCKADYKQTRALRHVLNSTETEHTMKSGDWGRYTLGYVVHQFQNRRLTEDPSSKYFNRFDSRFARAYIIRRVLELGLEHSDDDQTLRSDGRGRPSIERLGKKYQWIGLHEFVGYLCDHFHLAESDPERVKEFQSGVNLRLEDIHDPVIRPVIKNSEKWRLARELRPWFIGLANPTPNPLSDCRRREIVENIEIESPGCQLIRNDGRHDWILLQGRVNWYEPLSCSRKTSTFSEENTQTEWVFCSYVIPSIQRQKFLQKMCRTRPDGNAMLSGAERFESSLDLLRTYPDGGAKARDNCIDTGFPSGSIWLTSLWFSNGESEDTEQCGIVPSPQLAELLDIRSMGAGFDFCTHNGDAATVNCDFNNQGLMFCRRDLLETACRAKRLSFFWRVYCWKWVPAERTEKYPSREYWAMFQNRMGGDPEFIDGGSHLMEPFAVEEKVVW